MAARRLRTGQEQGRWTSGAAVAVAVGLWQDTAFPAPLLPRCETQEKTRGPFVVGPNILLYQLERFEAGSAAACE